MPGGPEEQTRRERIDPQLAEAGWDVVPHKAGTPKSHYTHHAVTEYQTYHGPADYALFVNAKLLGIVEAKKLTLGPQNALVQAERYSLAAEESGFTYPGGHHVPFVYSTNGEVLWFHDVRLELNRSRRIVRFHTPDALEELLRRDSEVATAALRALPNDHPRLRPYQREANAAIEAAIADRKHQMLVAMATGTGKTFMMVNQTYRLLKSGVAKRILFLVDRRALAAQAVRAFAAFEAEPNKKFTNLYEVYSQRFQKEDFDDDEPFNPTVMPNAYLTHPKAKHAFVYVCTIQRMAVNLFGRQATWSAEEEGIDKDAKQLKIPNHAFDIVIADECHRGYTTAEQSLWRNTLNHFDAAKIGLTATPAAHTKAYFNDIVFRYEFSRAVREGYLVDYDPVKVKSEARLRGIFLKEGESVEVVNPETGSDSLDSMDDERDFDATEVERIVTSPDSNRRILEEIKKYALEHEQRYGRMPKTLIFAVNDLPHTSHADQLVQIAREVYGRGDSYVQKITGSPTVDRPLQRIREFRNRPAPGIVVSVDLMSTGVDIPDLEFIVFLRPVKSRIFFEQMLGRGTRKGDKFPDKSHFTVFDCFDGSLLEYFRNSTGITCEPPDRPSRTIREIVEDIWANRDRDYNVRCVVKRLQRIEKEMSGEARAMFAARGIPNGDLGGWASGLLERLRKDFTATMALLRSEAFLKLLEKYPRRSRTFIRAIEHEDQVSSQYLIRDELGNEYKPADYLELFARFVAENAARIDAIRILLDRPAQWSTEALAALRNAIATSPQHFREELLQRAHEVHYHKALVDIISMVKHAAREVEPLLTSEERVAKAFAKLTAGRTFTPEQQQWLERIRAHLVANLTIEREDFETLPVFTRDGGWCKANAAFTGCLLDTLRALNAEVAA